MKTLSRTFFRRPPEQVAPDLLGKLLVRELGGQLLIGRIVETEAYLAEDDDAAHASRGKTAANSSLFLDGGHAYVHRIHTYYCLDAVCQTQNAGGSVLIRALEPIQGIEAMKKLRNKQGLMDLTTGPGKLCMAFGIDKSLDGIDLTRNDSPLRICDANSSGKFAVEISRRIGISKSTEFELRYALSESKFVSR
ncbi:MAG: DNA-3-methyladenine glycosylase [Candidatus Dojkabacteria bacterium]|nr:MAG: DNA-3-methyladenine glycosylase [Candidatus Dojkabacteria bacterium]